MGRMNFSRARQCESARHGRQVFVDDHPFSCPHWPEFGGGERLGADDILHGQHVEQRRIDGRQRAKRLDAIEREAVLRLDGGHVVRVLPGDDGIVAADIHQIMMPGSIGVERARTSGVEGSDTPIAGLVIEPANGGRSEVE